MAGDLSMFEGVVIDGSHGPGFTAESKERGPGRVVHQYGRVNIVEVPAGAEQEAAETGIRAAGDLSEEDLRDLTPAERLGIEALRLRESKAFRTAKQEAARDGRAWDLGGCTTMPVSPLVVERTALGDQGTSDYLEDTVGVGVVLVSGPGDLAITPDEHVKIVAELQEALSWYYSVKPAHVGLVFRHEVTTVTLDIWRAGDEVKKEDLEAHWLKPTLEALKESSALSYANTVRQQQVARWGYGAFITKYPLSNFGYAYLGGPCVVMDAGGGPMGRDRLDTIFAHETGHIFGCPDEYGKYEETAGDWGQVFGRFSIPNGNSETLAQTGGSTDCLMKHNSPRLCDYSTRHLGWAVEGPLVSLAEGSMKVMDVRYASLEEAAPLIQWPYNGGDNQRFNLRAVGQGELCIEARHSGKVLTVAAASTAELAFVRQEVWRNLPNQRFRLEDDGPGYRLVAVHSNMVLDILTLPGQQFQGIVQRPRSGAASQRWTFRALPVQVRHSGKVLDVSGASKQNGAQVIQYSPHDGDNQQFLVEPLGNGFVRFVAKHSGKVLDVAGASLKMGTPVIQWEWNGGQHQQFSIEDQGDGTSRIFARHSRMVLDVENASVDDGARLIQWKWNGGRNQRWNVSGWGA
jgi:hypothetical protein